MPILAVLLGALANAPQGTIDVFAAASLRESFAAIASSFERSHPGSHVRLSFAGSQQLAAQIDQGAPCDLFASADQRNLDKIAYDPVSRKVFALNRLVIATPSNETAIRRLPDLAAAPRIVLAAPAVPAGEYALRALDTASKALGAKWLAAINSHVVSHEVDVREVLSKVELGEADAGIVYATDAEAAKGKVRSVSIPAADQPRIEYPMSIPRSAANPALSREFESFVLGRVGQAELYRHGFIPAKR